MKKMRMNESGAIGIVLIIFGCLVGATLALIFFGYMFLNGLRSTSVNLETQLNAQYLANQNYLSAYISGFYEQTGLANLKSEKMDTILMDAAKGKFGENGFSSNGSFISAIKEAYPDLAGLNVYDKIVDYVASKREGYRAIQEKLLDMLRGYDLWREDGYIQSEIIANILKIPSQRLEARIGSNVVRGAEAREKMYLIVLAKEAVAAYETGTMEPLKAK